MIPVRVAQKKIQEMLRTQLNAASENCATSRADAL